MIAHFLPGRIRLRPVKPLSRDELDEFGRRVREIVPSATLTHTPKSGSILVVFSELDRTEAVVEILRPLSPPELRATSPAGRPCLRWPSMTVVKRGMAGSLVASLGLLALRREGGHALAGGLFLVFLSRHLWVYRKRLMK